MTRKIITDNETALDTIGFIVRVLDAVRCAAGCGDGLEIRLNKFECQHLGELMKNREDIGKLLEVMRWLEEQD